jgi:CheY-like chemotaxis protein
VVAAAIQNRVLVVDDSDEVREIIRSFLEDAGLMCAERLAMGSLRWS